MDGKAAGNCGFAFSAVRTVDMVENWYGLMVVSQASTIVPLLTPAYQSTRLLLSHHEHFDEGSHFGRPEAGGRVDRIDTARR